MNKLEGFPTINCISLEESIARRELLSSQFSEYGLTPNYLLSKRYTECKDTVFGVSLHSVDEKVIACAVSHLKMIKKWYDTTDEEYGFFCEDDLSLETIPYWSFTFHNFMQQLPSDWEALQLCIIRDSFIDIFSETTVLETLKERQLDDWSVTAYILKREYAKKLIDQYIFQLKDILYNLPPCCGEATAYKLEVNNWPLVQPLAEHIILLNTGKVYCCPLFIENISGPTTSSNEQAPNHIYSSNFIMDWWRNIKNKSETINITKELQHIYDQPQFGENWFTYPNLYKKAVKEALSGSKFVEIGSWKGKSSAFMAVEIANSNKDIEFYCIDTWEGSTEHQDMDNLESLYATFIQNMMPLVDYYVPIKTTSLKASALFEDESLDFVFIDASHEYDDVRNDITAWLPKIKNNGTIAGHDYYTNPNHHHPGVKKAVDEIFNTDELIFDESCWVY
jgi:predicted O-methyltransferase YrrM/GR25 family glycosyltransferase involved in LPS biosynthesis